METFLDKIEKIYDRSPVLFRAVTWTLLLTFTVAVASFVPEMAYMSTLASSYSSKPCGIGGRGGGDGFVRIPMDIPGEMVCVPAEMVKRSAFDVFLPTIFAGVMVFASASLIRSCFKFESDDVDRYES